MSFSSNPDKQGRIPDRPPPREHISRVSITMLLAFLALIVVIYAWNPIMHSFKIAWGRHCAREAQAALADENWNRAVEFILAARKWAPEEVEVRRVIIDFLKISGSDPGGLVQQLHMLSETQPLTEEERLLLGRTLTATGKTAEARAVYETLPLGSSTRKPALELLSSILQAEGHDHEAKEVSRRATLQKSETPSARLNAALEERRSSFVEIQQQARHELWQLAQLDSEIAMEAVTHLTVDPTLSVAQARQLLQIIEGHAHKSLPVRLGVISALMRLQPDQRATLLDKELQHFQTEEDGTLEDMARWLALEGQHARLLKLVPMKLALKSRNLYPIIAQALATEQRWQELKEMLTDSRPPVSQARVAIWLAEASSHLAPDLQEARRLLESSIEASNLEGNPANLLAAAVVAEKLNLPEVALSAYQIAASKVGEKALPLLQKAHEIALLQKNTNILLQIARKLHELRPSSAAFSDRLIYLRLILGVEMESIDFSPLKKSSSIHAAFTIALERIPPPLLLALAAYRLGDPDSVPKHLADLEDTAGLPAGQRAVAAGLLSLSGKQDRAYQIAEKVPETLLLNEERAFLQRAR